MPFIRVNDVDLYYEAFGEDKPDQAPVVLIHGSTMTGRSDWGWVAPLLARHYRVIVPDCRGHGQSANPRLSYAFREMAADIAGLIHALGDRRAHLIGHSNGGNVALVTLLEHPEVVQTAVLQAANAYVSQDLVEKEPPLFDPDRVARERPEWMSQLIALHGPAHGPDYWRDLLRLTLKELIHEPNYTPQDLSQVSRPVLIIQGENDRVNAPSRHAQFIARHIPDAELWIPPGTGHNVHLDLLFPWVERVLDFLTRRGEQGNDILYRLRRRRYGDERSTVFEVKASLSTGLSGRVLTASQAQEAGAAVSALVERPLAAISELRILLDDTTPWALVERGVTDLRREPANQAERLSQALFGEAVRILEERGDWAQVRMEKDGYLGWLHISALHHCSREEVQAYRAACNHLVKADLANAYHKPVVSSPEIATGGEEAGKLPFGLPVPVVERRHSAAAVRTPGGEVWWVSDLGLLPIEERPRPDPGGIAFTLSLIRRFVGVPYLWGGRTPFGFDCSGLSQTFLGFLGVHARRDADQQFRDGIPVEGNPQPGDLLFFGEDEDQELHQTGDSSYGGDRRITHMAISLGGTEFIHANGTAWRVSYNSLNPESPLYRPRLSQSLAGVRRFWE